MVKQYVKRLAQHISSIYGTVCCLLSWSVQISEILAKAGNLVTVSLLGQNLCVLPFLYLSTPFPDLCCYDQAKPQHLLPKILQPVPTWSPISPFPPSNSFPSTVSRAIIPGFKSDHVTPLSKPPHSLRILVS